MDASDNMELRRYDNDRQIWLVQPDLETEQASPNHVPVGESASFNKDVQ